MHAMKGLAVGVLAALLAGSGCCKLCDWCHGGSERQSRSVTADGLPAANVATYPAPGATAGMPATNRLPTGTPASQQPAQTGSVQVGAYGGSGY
jgi:hypothetical protein